MYQSGHELIPLGGYELKKYHLHFRGNRDRPWILKPGGWFLLEKFEHFADKLYNFKFKSSDVMVMTFPKCGTTWTQEIVWTMRNNPDLNHSNAQDHKDIRTPFLELDTLRPVRVPGEYTSKDYLLKEFHEACPGKDPTNGMFLQLAEFAEDPRTIKTHLPFSLLTPSLLDTAKVVYAARNPKDVMVSLFHHLRIVKSHSYVGTFDDFVQRFMDGHVMFSPYWLHVKEAWERRHHPNLHFIFYEDLKADPLEEIKKLDTFLETRLTEKQMKNVLKYTSFNEMKARDRKKAPETFINQNIAEKDGGLYRKGMSGDWKNHFTPELETKIDEWIQNQFLSFGLTFK